MTIKEARQIIATAVKDGKIDLNEAQRRQDALYRLSRERRDVRVATNHWVSDLV